MKKIKKEPFKCKYCDYETSCSVGIKVHIGKVHKDVVEQVTCEKCNETFSKQIDLFDHKLFRECPEMG